MTFEIFQVNDSHRELAFRSLKSTDVSRNAYDSVFHGGFDFDGSDAAALEELFFIFNMNRPDDFHGHSMSVSDVVVLNDSDAWFCDSFGFKKIRFE